jgi:hypothetical protein
MVLRLGVVLPVKLFAALNVAMEADDAALLSEPPEVDAASNLESSVCSIWGSSPELDVPILLMDMGCLLDFGRSRSAMRHAWKCRLCA